MQVTQWQIAVQTQVSSETPRDLKAPYPIEPILQVVREKNFFCFIRSSAQTWVVHQSPEAFILQNILINYFVHSMQKNGPLMEDAILILEASGIGSDC